MSWLGGVGEVRMWGLDKMGQIFNSRAFFLLILWLGVENKMRIDEKGL